MGNLGFVSSKSNLNAERVGADLDEINERRFGGFFNVFVPHDDAWDIGYTDEKGEHQSLWYWHLQSKRKIGGKRPRPNYQWVEWAWAIFQAELGVKWGGRLSDEGVPGTWGPKEELKKYVDLPAYLKSHYSYLPDDHPNLEQIWEYAREQIVETMPEAFYPHAFPTEVGEMRSAIEKTARGLGIKIKFEADDDLGKYRRGKQLTMGELRALDEGTVVWLYIYYKESVRADSAFRLEHRDNGWFFDDGSSLAADFQNKNGADGDPAQNEWTKIYAAIPDVATGEGR